MKINKTKSNQKILTRFYWRTLAILAMAVVIIIVLRTVLRGKMANLMVTFMSKVLGIDWEAGKHIYWERIEGHLDLIILIAVILVFLILFRISLVMFNRYFTELERGIAQLAQETEEPIELRSGLEQMEETLNDVRLKLIENREKIHEAEHRRNDLVLYLAHDIKTPLTSVVGYLNLLDESRDMPSQQKDKYVTIAREKAERLGELINEFFDITRYTYQAEQLYLQEVNLAFMLMQVSDEMYPQLTKRKKTLTIAVPDDIYLKMDPEKMARVFQNIIKNAIAYGKEGCEIKIWSEEQDEDIVIHLQNKADIPPGKAEKLFEKFYRLDGARSTETGGAGLGLAIAKDIVVLHNGEIHATSDSENIEFIIRLPRNL
ncbi:sensor histidine kinase [Eubacterium oxidoreducens]|uniref:histidine kinase n=1 Tax=Eubacterium oxidoreducens TaxID=1732 RepID=A0A1G6C705_EUBOX|nr:HAMP domain-containing sensor histidine kinase [Eubacterium oxidoreducens]SDB28683.1 two-component system, OmpR family, sensor histidine kinase VanS [Eubacterium oxidoreducens]